ncbi:hypothetical protein KX816_04075 [Sphingosinicellaceae bacterium]|nr:hypothetical protein KX816_04075 [Sphingosinicellaceae bacterium]
MSGTLAWFGGAMVASMLLMLVVLAVRRPVTRVFGPTVAYALWLLPALRMLLPSLPGEWMPGNAAMVFDPPRMVGLTNMPPPPPVDAGTDWAVVLLATWLIGAVGYFAWQLVSHHIFMERSLEGSAALTHAAGIEVRQGPGIAGPMAAGVLRRRILLPNDFAERFTPEERRLALAHETAHHCRGDLVANLAGLALLSLHWFNPVAHFAYRAFRDDQEAACDATVLGAESDERRYAYGTAILKSASCRVPGAACALNHAGTMKRRILIMIDGRKSRALRLGGAALAAVLVGGGLVATASTVAAPAKTPTHHMTFITGTGDNITITHDGHTRRATPAERRRIEHDVAQAEAGRRVAERGAERAERERTAMLAEMPRPPARPAAPRAPNSKRIAEVPPAPEAPPAPPTPPEYRQGAHDVSLSWQAEYPIDRNAIRAEIDAAMASARQAVADASVQLAAVREQMTAASEAQREAMAESRADQRDAMRDVAQARRDAAQGRRDAAQAVRDAEQNARREAATSL